MFILRILISAVLVVCTVSCSEKSCKSHEKKEEADKKASPSVLKTFKVEDDASIQNLIRLHGKTVVIEKCIFDMEDCSSIGLKLLNGAEIHTVVLLASPKFDGSTMKPVIILPNGTRWDLGDNPKKFAFPPQFSDASIQELAMFKNLRKVVIWYGSLTDQQKTTIRAKAPDCEIVENVNAM